MTITSRFISTFATLAMLVASLLANTCVLMATSVAVKGSPPRACIWGMTAAGDLIRCIENIRMAFIRGKGVLAALKFDQDRPLRQSGFAGLNLADEPGQKASAERLESRPGCCRIGFHRCIIRDRTIDNNPISLLHGISFQWVSDVWGISLEVDPGSASVGRVLRKARVEASSFSAVPNLVEVLDHVADLQR